MINPISTHIDRLNEIASSSNKNPVNHEETAKNAGNYSSQPEDKAFISSGSTSEIDSTASNIKPAAASKKEAASKALENDKLEKSQSKGGKEDKKENKILNFIDKASEAYYTIDDSLSSFPGFIYPSVTGASAAEAAYTYQVLDKLPLKDVASVSNIEWVEELFMTTDKTAHASGVAYATPAPFVKIARDQCGDLGKWAEKVIIHETGHTRDYSEGFLSVIQTETANSDIWGHGERITEYAKTNPREDFAESFMTYYTDPEALKAKCPEKYERIKELEEIGKFEGIVEQDAFRETGKWIGQKLSDYPYLQTIVKTGSYVLGGVALITDSADLIKGVKENDPELQMHGSMGATATLLSFSGFPIAGTAVDGARRALGRAIDKGEITAEEANYVSSHTAGAPLTGLVKLGKWAHSKIFASKAENQVYEQNETTAQPGSEHKVSLKDSKKALAIGAGGAIGSALGSVAGIYAGVTAGFAIGGPVGGVIGLIAGAVLGNETLNRLGAKIGSAIGDKIQSEKNVIEMSKENEQNNKKTETNANEVT